MANTQSNIASNIAINPSTGNVTTPAAFAAGNQPPLPTSYASNAGTANALMGPLGTSTPPTPNQSVASQTHTDAAGNSVKTTYSPTSTGMLNTPAPSGLSSNQQTQYNALISAGATPSAALTAVQAPSAAFGANYAGTAGGSEAPSTATNTVPNTTSNPNANYNAGITPAVNQPVTTAPTSNTAANVPTASGLLSTVAGYGQQDPGLTDLYNQQQALTNQYAGMVGNIQNTPTTLNEQTGRLASIQDEYNTAESNLANTYQANLAQRAQGIGASESALGTATQQVQSPYGTPLFNPATGTVTSGGQTINSGNTGLIGGSTGSTSSTPTTGIQPNDLEYAQVQYWAQQVANGYPVSSLPAPFNNGVVQTQIQQMATSLPSSSGSTYNPVTTSQNVQGATTQNISTAQGYAGQASAVNNIQNNISSLAPQIHSFMAANGINNSSGLPLINGSVLTYLQNSDPGAASSWTQYVNELNNYASQILATKGITPTGSESQLTNLNLNTLTSNQLSTFLQTLNNVATSYYTQLSNSANKALQTNNQPGTLYTGNTPAPTPSTVTTPVATPNASNNNPTWVKALGGFVQGTVNDIAGLAGSLFNAL